MIEANKLLAATGRNPNTAALGLEEIGVKIGDVGQIIVSQNGQTSIPSIFAIGDVTNRVNLTPVAIGEGHAFADNCYGNNPRTMSHDFIASAVFSQPPISCVGLTEQQAVGKNINFNIYELDAVFLSHPHQDHMEGLFLISETIPIHHVYVSRKPELQETHYQDLWSIWEKQQIDVVSQHHFCCETAKFSCFGTRPFAR